MIGKTDNVVRYFQSDEAKRMSTDTVCFGVVSKAVAVKDSKYPKGIKYENWKARFIGDACKKCKELKDKDMIIITTWEVTNDKTDDGYDYYIVISDFRKK